MASCLARPVLCLLASLTAVLAGAGPAAAWTLRDAVFPGASLVAAAPANSGLPAISGTVASGSVLTVSTGTWSGSPTSFAYQWQRDSGSGFAAIPGGTTSAYAVPAGDAGSSLRVQVTATNATGSATATAPAVGPVGAAVPTNSAAPAITGTPRRGVALTAGPGSWNPSGTFAYQWQHDAGSGFVAIAGATSSVYTPAVADVGLPLRVVVTATNTYGSTSAASAATAAVLASPPVNTSLPAISGTARRTFTLTATPGSWSPAGATYTYQWQRDTGSGFADITGASGSSYTLATADVGATVRVQVTATNPDGGTAAASAASATVAPASPVSTAAPVLSGTTRVGQTLTTSDGAWNPAATSFAYQWQRDSGSGFADIAGATAASYTLVAADLGARIRVRVTGTNSEGSGQGVSAAGGVVTQAPVATTAPGVPTGTLTDTFLLTADPGVWTPSSATLTFQWLRCPAGATGITSACQLAGNGSTYTLVASDVGHPMGVRVTAYTPGGTTVASSPLTAAVAGRALTNVAPPTLSGTPQIADAVRAVGGSWSVPLTGAAYQWQRCDADGTNCADIAGATAQEYTPTVADHGHQIAIRETATSPGRTASATSTPVTVNDQPLPVNGVLPVVAGTPKRLQYLRVGTGSWSAHPSSYAYQWQRCDADGTNCADIAGATTANYRLVEPDVGHVVQAAVSATNTSGTVTATSAPTPVIAAVLPILHSAPTITGVMQLPGMVQAVRPLWESTPETRFAYQWRRCDTAGANCVDIPGATGPTYKLISADVGQRLRVAHIATNDDGTVTGVSTPGAVVLPAKPGFSRRPVLAIDGSPTQVGRTLTITGATWVTDTTSSAVTLWRCVPRCTAVSLGGATTYTLTSADAGALMRLSDTGTGPGGTTEVWSLQSYGPVRSAAVAVAPLVAGATTSLVSGSGATLATASASASASTASVAHAAASRPATVRIRVRRRAGAGHRALRVWACRQPAASTDRSPCTAAVSLRARVTLRLALARGQRLQVVVAPPRRSAK